MNPEQQPSFNFDAEPDAETKMIKRADGKLVPEFCPTCKMEGKFSRAVRTGQGTCPECVEFKRQAVEAMYKPFREQEQAGWENWKKELVTHIEDYKAKKAHGGVDVTAEEFFRDYFVAYRRGLDPAKRMKFDSLTNNEQRIEFMMKDFETWKDEE